MTYFYQGVSEWSPDFRWDLYIFQRIMVQILKVPSEKRSPAVISPSNLIGCSKYRIANHRIHYRAYLCKTPFFRWDLVNTALLLVQYEGGPISKQDSLTTPFGTNMPYCSPNLNTVSIMSGSRLPFPV